MTISLISLGKSPDRTYSARNPLVRWYFWSRLAAMVQVVQSCDPKLILDIGCGRGELLGLLAKEFATSRFVAIDLGKDIYVARRGARMRRIQSLQFVRADARFLPLRSDCSQLVFCASVLEHLPDALPVASEIARILEPNGRLVVGVPTENLLYRIARKLVGLRKPIDHYHHGAYVDTLLKESFALSISRKLPFSLLPRFLTLYLVSAYVKSQQAGCELHLSMSH